MKVGFNTQIHNPEKHTDMPNNYPFHVYEVDNSFDETQLISEGYQFLPKVDYDAYVAAIDMTDYNNAIAPTIDVIIEEQINAIKNICEDLIAQFQLENILMGIAPPLTGQVTLYLHKLFHFLEVQATDQALVELTTLINGTIDPDLSPFITASRLTTFKEQLELKLSEL